MKSSRREEKRRGVIYIKRALSPSNPVYGFFCFCSKFPPFLRKIVVRGLQAVAEGAGGGVVVGERFGAGAGAAAAAVGGDATER